MTMEQSYEVFQNESHFSESAVASINIHGVATGERKWQSGQQSVASLEVVIVDDRPLFRECLARGLVALDARLKLIYISSCGELEELEGVAFGNVRIILISQAGSSGEPLWSQIEQVKEVEPASSVVVLSETEDLREILHTFEAGARGYIPASIGLDIAVKAMQLVAAGGIYVPASILSGCSEAVKGLAANVKAQPEGENVFASKQIAVMEALRRGKANKTIAYDLNMCESTVKVHVRNVMKKLRARNRTEAAFILNEKMKQ